MSKALGSIKLIEESVPGKTGQGQETQRGERREERRAEREKLLLKVDAMETKLLREISSLDAQVRPISARVDRLGITLMLPSVATAPARPSTCSMSTY